VGQYEIRLGGLKYYQRGDLDHADILVPLHDLKKDGVRGLRPFSAMRRLHVPQAELFTPGHEYTIIPAYLTDFGGLPGDWGNFLERRIIPRLREGRSLESFCIGSHGRSGSILASLIALLEPDVEDPIAAARERHCRKCVETPMQAEGIFALRGLPVPEQYRTWHRH
jgi:hypothetical protein